MAEGVRRGPATPPIRHDSESEDVPPTDVPRAAKRERSQSSSSSSSSRKKKKNKKEAKKAKKQARKEEGFAAKVAKTVRKVIEHNKKLDKGRPPTLVKAALTSVLAILVPAHKEPNSIKHRIVKPDDARLKYLRSINYGMELLMRCGFEEDENEHFFSIKHKAAPIFHSAIPVVQDALLEITAKIPDEKIRVSENSVGEKGLRGVLGDVEETLGDKAKRYIGGMLGAVCGDALGLPFANWNGEVLRKWFGEVSEFHALPPAQRNTNMDDVSFKKGTLGMYSGEATVALSILMSILEHKRLDCRLSVKKVIDDYRANTERGNKRMYAESLRVQLDKLLEGVDHRKTGMCLNPSGIKGADAPALILPMALVYSNEDDATIMSAIKGALLPFVIHPDGIGASYAFAHALIYLLKHEGELQPRDFILFVKQKAEQVNMSDYLRRSLSAMLEAMGGDGKIPASYLECIEDDEMGEESETVFTSAIGALCGALYAFVNNWRDPVSAVSAAVGLGEAASILGVMCGGMCGVLHKYSWIPKSWFNLLENDDGRAGTGVGRDRIIELAIDAADTKPGKTRNYEEPLPFEEKKYKYKKRTTIITAPPEDDTQPSNAAPPPGTDALVAAMPISLRKFAPDSAFRPS